MNVSLLIADVASDPISVDDSSSGWIIAIVAVIAVAVIALGLFAKRRKGRGDA